VAYRDYSDRQGTEAEAGGNTRWSPSNMRMVSPERVEPSFVHDMLTATQLKGDESYFARLAADAPLTIKWLQSHGIEFTRPPYYLSIGPPRIQPVGGGANLIKVLSGAAKQAGVTFRYGCSARELVTEGNRLVGIAIEQADAREAGRRRRAGLRQLPGQCRDDVHASWRRRRTHAADLAGHPLQYRRRHRHGPAARC
jgi:aspartate oxidase